ncbi:MAG TPA: DoxX family protein [Microvirga sp.]|nr:DoxX family protein [Microvirga sp.]
MQAREMKKMIVEPQDKAAPAGSARFAGAVGPLLGIAFLFLAGAKLNEPGRFAENFEAWGLDPGLVPWTGAVEFLVGLGIFFHGTRTVAAAVLVAWMAGAAAIHVRAGDPGLAALPLTIALVAAGVAVSGFRAGLHRVLRMPAPLRNPPGTMMGAVGFLVPLVGVSFLLRWAVGGTLFWASLPVLALMHAHTVSAASKRQRVELVLLYLLVLGLGTAGLWMFVGHYFMSDQVAGSIGWATGSPFQHELAFYHLGMGVVALLCLWIRDRYWIAAAVTPALFAMGAGVVHLQDFISRGNTAPANWGASVLIGNLVIPVVVLGLLAWYSRLGGWKLETTAGEGIARF